MGREVSFVGSIEGGFGEGAHVGGSVDKEDVVVLDDQIERCVGRIADELGTISTEELYVSC